jgi:hypothetical protein
MADRAYLEQFARKLADEGKLIEAGWVGLRILCVPQTASPAQIDDMRLAFMAGAQHLFVSIMTILDPGTEETAADMARMDLIHRELETVRKELELRVARPKGSG